jgi:hypothetical protein
MTMLARILGAGLLLTISVTASAQPKPDLKTEIADVYIDLGASVDGGDVQEGCASAAFGVDLLRFSTIISNVGTADLFLGDPQCPDCTTNPGANLR